MKLPLLAAAALMLVSIPAHAATPTPVGTWVVSLSGADQGIAYTTFAANRTLSGYGLTRNARGLFTLTGTWTVDSAGKVSVSYTEQVDGGTVTGNLSGKLSNGQITGSIAATNGSFSFRATPETTTQVMTGTWSGVASIGSLRLPEIYQITPNARPHVFDIVGTGVSPSGQFAILGNAIVGAGGKVQVVVASQYSLGPATFTSLSGNFNAAARLNVLRGTESGKAVQVVLRR